HYKSRFTEYHGHSHSPYIILATFVVTAENELTIKQLVDTLNLWLIRINYLKQPKVYPSIETAQPRHYSERDREKIEKNKRRMIRGFPQ
ncbi:LLM class flavin-dependent oxidoreductase, partial [Staphylococcus warneri]